MDELEMVDVSGIDKAVLFAALYNAAAPRGNGFIHYDPTPMSIEEASEEIEQRRAHNTPLRFDYYRGRAMKIDISGDLVNPSRYDSYNEKGAVIAVVLTLRHGLSPNNPFIAEHHEVMTANIARVTAGKLEQPDVSLESFDGIRVYSLGLVGDRIAPKLEAILAAHPDEDEENEDGPVSEG